MDSTPSPEIRCGPRPSGYTQKKLDYILYAQRDESTATAAPPNLAPTTNATLLARQDSSQELPDMFDQATAVSEFCVTCCLPFILMRLE